VFAIRRSRSRRLEPAQVAELRAIAPLLAEAPPNELTALIDVQAGGAELTLIRQGNTGVSVVNLPPPSGPGIRPFAPVA